VHQQSQGFTRLQEWDFENTPPEAYPLLLNYPYFDLYRKQVVKQADLVMAMYTRGDYFTPEQKIRNVNYYEPLTVRDSSLSACVQAVLAAEVGYLDLAYDYFAEAALTDMLDLHANVRNGLHIASLAGAWTVAVAGFGGMRDHDQSLAFAPRLPSALTRLAFRLTYRESRFAVEIDQDGASYTLLEGPSLTVRHHGEEVALTKGAAGRRPIPALEPREAPTQPKGRAPRRRTPKLESNPEA
jgi:alpha,alpha-trehalose phosphorylase